MVSLLELFGGYATRLEGFLCAPSELPVSDDKEILNLPPGDKTHHHIITSSRQWHNRQKIPPNSVYSPKVVQKPHKKSYECLSGCILFREVTKNIGKI